MEFTRVESINGAPVFFCRIPDAKSFISAVLVGVGTRNESWPQEAGLAHATEHMLFQGTDLFPNSKSLEAHIEDVGGKLNAWTSKEKTLFWAQVPANEYRRALLVTSQQVLEPLLPEEKIPTEMKNIVEEIRRFQDNAASLVVTNLIKALFGSHFLARDTLGKEDSVLSFTKEKFQDFMRSWYHPANFTHIIVGPVSLGLALSALRGHYPLISCIGSPNINHWQNIRDPQKDIIAEKDIQQAKLAFGAAFPRGNKRSDLAFLLFKNMIDGGASFPLFQEIRDKRGLCYEVDANLRLWTDAGIFFIYIGTNPERTDEAISATHDVIQKSKSDESLLMRAKKLLRGRMALKFESPVSILSEAVECINLWGRPETYESLVAEIESLTIEEIGQVVDRFLESSQFSCSKVLPKN